MSFKAKTVLGIAAIELVLLFILVTHTLQVLRTSNESQIKQRVDTLSALLMASSKDAMMSYDLATLDSIITDIIKTDNLNYIRYILPNGKVLAKSQNAPKEDINIIPDIDITQVEDGILDWATPVESYGQPIGVIQFGVSLKELEALIESATRKTVIIAAIEVVLVALFSVFLGNYLTRNLAELRRASQQVAEGNFNIPLTVKGQDELAETAVAFNAMIASLEERTLARMEALKDAQVANEAKSAFIASMSHELRTPLNSIIGFTNILIRKLEGEIDERKMKSLQTVLKNAELLLEMVNGILDLSAIASGKMDVRVQTFNAEDLFKEAKHTVKQLFKEKGLSLDIILPKQPVILETDKSKLRQVLVNYLSNAAKYTDSGGVVLRMEMPSKSTALFLVEDTGQGIPPEQEQYLFERFARLNKQANAHIQGTGLGLSLVNEYAGLLGGKAGYSPREGGGSIFSVIIPIAHQNPAENKK